MIQSHKIYLFSFVILASFVFIFRSSISFAFGPLTLPFWDQVYPISQGWSTSHTGIDYDTPNDPTPPVDVVASANGLVIYWEDGWDNDPACLCYGNYVKVSHPNNLITLYAHLKKNTLTPPVINYSAVVRGNVLAKENNSGWSTGDHLHFESRINNISVDPYTPPSSGSSYLWTTDPPSLSPFFWPPIYVSGFITQNTTWTSGGVYVVQGDVTVNSGVTLTIESGVVVKFNNLQYSGSIYVNGNLIATGSPINKIYFTSYKDDSVGGDTNGDGDATSPAPQDYRGIFFEPGSSAFFENAVLRYGGDYVGPTWVIPGVIKNEGGNVNIVHSEIQNNYYGAFVSNVSSLSIDASVISNNSNYGIYASVSTTTNITVTNTLFDNNTIYDVRLSGPINFINSGNIFSTSSRGFYLSGIQPYDQTWNPGVPFVVDYYTIPAGKTLTIQPGTVLKFMPGWGAGFYVFGNLIAQATSSQKIYFTSLKDDSVGGDTNGDGNATSPAPQDYRGIFFEPGSSGHFVNAVLRYGGDYLGPYWVLPGVIKNGGGNVSIRESDIQQNYFGAYLKDPGSLTIDTSIISNNNSYGISASVSTTTNLTVTNTLFDNNTIYDVRLSGPINFINSGNIFSTSSRGFYLSGIQPYDQTWNPGVPFVVDYYTIPVGKTLTIQPGTVVKFIPGWGAAFFVFGQLIARGTLGNKIYFTSFHDDAVGGDTNGNGSATIPAPQDYRGIFFEPGSSAFFENAVLRYGGDYLGPTWVIPGVIKNRGGNIVVSKSQMYSNYYGITQSSGDTAVSSSMIVNNLQYGIYNSGSKRVTAASNWWGTPSGPYHQTLNPNGTGNQVSNNVNFIPWLNYDPTTFPFSCSSGRC